MLTEAEAQIARDHREFVQFTRQGRVCLLPGVVIPGGEFQL